MSDQEFAEFLKSLPREKSEAEVEDIERQHDAERGLYIPHGLSVHHLADESRH